MLIYFILHFGHFHWILKEPFFLHKWFNYRPWTSFADLLLVLFNDLRPSWNHCKYFSSFPPSLPIFPCKIVTIGSASALHLSPWLSSFAECETLIHWRGSSTDPVYCPCTEAKRRNPMTMTVTSVREEGRSVHVDVIQNQTNKLHCSDSCILFDKLTRKCSFTKRNALRKIHNSEMLLGRVTFTNFTAGVNNLSFVHGEYQST